MANFDIAFEKTLDAEGGYLLRTVKGDNGGMTFAGISRVYWPDWTGWQLIDGGEVSGPRIESMVHGFFKIHFWDVIKGDQIGFQLVADVIYDFAVNSGIDDAVMPVQKIVGSTVDGKFGPKTFAKLNAYIINEMAEELFCAKYNLLRLFHLNETCVNDSTRRGPKANEPGHAPDPHPAADANARWPGSKVRPAGDARTGKQLHCLRPRLGQCLQHPLPRIQTLGA